MVNNETDLLDDFYEQDVKPEKGWAFRPAAACHAIKLLTSLVYFYINIQMAGFRFFSWTGFVIWLIGVCALVLFLLGHRIGWILVVFSAVVTTVLNIADQIQSLVHQSNGLFQNRVPFISQITAIVLNFLIIYFACNFTVTRYFNVNATFRKSVLIIAGLGALFLSFR